jgi:hypothetical protein
MPPKVPRQKPPKHPLKRPLNRPLTKHRNKRKAHSARFAQFALLALLVLLSVAGLLFAQWRGFKASFTSSSFTAPQSPTPQLTKEYIYAGGKLLATEEPITGGGVSPLSAPSSMVATGMTTPSTQVNLSWSASTGATVSYYVVERCQSFSANCYSVVAANVAPDTPTITYSDVTVASGVAYLYRVRAVDANGNFSAYSSADLATAITFEDDPLISIAENQSGATPVRAVHLTQLRSAVNAVRALGNLSPPSWTNAVQTGSVIRAVDVQELRTQLDQARAQLGLSQATYSNQPLSQGTPVRKTHFDELRSAVK